MIKLANILLLLIQKMNKIKEIYPKIDYKINESPEQEIELILYNPYTDLNLDFSDILPKIKVDYIPENDYNDTFYQDFFSDKGVLKGYTYTNQDKNHSFINLQSLEYAVKIEQNGVEISKTLPPIISFYSYKGGVGRTTTLMSFALHCAYHEKKKVLVLDCDFEAPGFVNFFSLKEDIEEKSILKNGGVVEYLMDKAFDSQTNIKDYIIPLSDIDSEYLRDGGDVFIMPAGDLRGDKIHEDIDINSKLNTYLGHYLHGLARLDISNPDAIAKQFVQLFQEATRELQPDLILIDSRTGFSEVLTNIVLRLANVIVGLFGTNKQSEAGLYHLLSNYRNETYTQNLVLVHSFKTNGDTEAEDDLQDFENIVNRLLGDKFGIVYGIRNNSALSKLGTKNFSKLAYLNLVKKEFPAHSTIDDNAPHLFDAILSMLPMDTQENKIELPQDLFGCKQNILNDLITFFEQNIRYAEEIDFSDEFLDKAFYYRDSMLNVFDNKKFIFKGSKGAGKSFFYNVLLNEKFVKNLKNKAKKIEKYCFFDVVSNPTSKNTQIAKFLSTSGNNLNPRNLGMDNSTYYKRFWVVYTWNSIYLTNNAQKVFQKEASFPIEPIKNDTDTTKRFENLMKDENYVKIEQDLRDLDGIFQSRKEYLVVLYDYLDAIVKPNEWWTNENKISPLIELWISNPYKNILPKLFVRNDLYDKLIGITNKPSLEYNIVQMDWKKEELFVYLFKILFSYSKESFIQYIKLSQVQEEEYLIEKIKELQNTENQVKIDNENLLLKKLVEIFFGEYVNIYDNRFGLSYDWFFKNLEDTKGVVSLRNFIILLKTALKSAKERDNKPTPILYGLYYSHKDTRSKAGEAHFEDLLAQEGNAYLKNIIDFMRNGRANAYRKSFLYEKELEAFLQKMIAYYSENPTSEIDREMTIPIVKNLLLDNGIIKHNINSPSYSFAFLYKYYLGLRAGD